MAKVEITYPGERVVSEITALVPRVTSPATSQPPRIGLVEISEVQPTDLIPGPPGPQGPRGSRWFTGNGPPSGTSGYVTGDMYLDNVTDEVWSYDGTTPWVDTGTNIHGSPDTGADILVKLAPVDGSGSGLDADTVDGEHATTLHAWANLTGVPITFPPTLPIAQSGVTNLVSDLALKAPLASPGLTGTPTAPTAPANTNTTQIASTAFVEAATAPAQLLLDIKGVDGAGSGLDADLLDGNDSAFYQSAANLNAGILPAARFDDTSHGNRGGGLLHALATAAVAGFLLDAPSDGTSYARRNAAWIATSAFVDAPNDGKTYARQSLGWVESVTKTYADTKVAKAGDTMTGNLTIDNASTALLVLDKGVSGQYSYIESRTNGVARWQLQLGDQVAESGSNAGSNFNVYRMSDAGAALENVFSINRATGAANFAQSLTVGGQINSGTNVIAAATVQAGSGIFQAPNTGNTAQWIGANVTAGYMFLRPNGYANGAGQLSLDVSGNCSVAGALQAGTSVSAANGFFVGAAANAFFGNSSGAGTLYFRPNGVSASAAGQMVVNPNGDVTISGQCNPNNIVESQSNATMIVSITAGATGTIYLRPDGSGTTSMQSTYNDSGNLNIAGPSGVKSTGTTWANPCDERIKTVTGDYEVGLDAILALQVRRFTYKGNETPTLDDENDPAFDSAMRKRTKESAPYKDSPHYKFAVDGTEVAGLVAQEAEKIMPSLVTQHRMMIDGVEVTDFRILDAGDITWALVNAVKTLAAHNDTLEARIAALEAA